MVKLHHGKPFVKVLNSDFILFVSLYTLCIASVDQYLAITRPVLYREGKYFSKKRVNLISGLGRMIGLLLAVSGRISGLDTNRLIIDFSQGL